MKDKYRVTLFSKEAVVGFSDREQIVFLSFLVSFIVTELLTKEVCEKSRFTRELSKFQQVDVDDVEPTAPCCTGNWP